MVQSLIRWGSWHPRVSDNWSLGVETTRLARFWLISKCGFNIFFIRMLEGENQKWYPRSEFIIFPSRWWREATQVHFKWTESKIPLPEDDADVEPEVLVKIVVKYVEPRNAKWRAERLQGIKRGRFLVSKAMAVYLLACSISGKVALVCVRKGITWPLNRHLKI